jgi:Cys-rich repeat protein
LEPAVNLRLLALVSLALAGCYSPNIPNGMQKCAANQCAAGYECGADGLCYKKGQVPMGGPDMAVSVDMTTECTQATCKAPTPICDPDGKQCVPCLTDSHCPDGKLCKAKQCVPGCSMAHGCGDAGLCDPNGMCKVCTQDADCAMDPGGPRCDTNSGRCVPCLPQNDNCSGGQFCKLVNGAYTCVNGCKVDKDCATDGGPPQVCCQNTCVDLTGDGANCGACGKACKQGESCCASACTDVTGDLANCGACGKACTGGHAVWQCTMGACAITGCQGSYKDCNVDPMDGCEANTTSDPNNCTMCGMKCAVPNGVAGCANGCFVQMCNAGFGNCNNNPADGCETNVAIDKANCGTCGKVCANVPNGFPGCAMGICIVGGCIAGFDDCDKQVANGCEATLTTDKNNCGMCGKVCPNPPNGTAACANSACGLGGCNAGFLNCNMNPADGCEINLNTDPNNCGGCAKVCSNANMASRTCGGGLCNGNCNPGFADCNANKLTDGCEINTTNDRNNCGVCGRICPNGQNCVASVCQLAGTLITTWNGVSFYKVQAAGFMTDDTVYNTCKNAGFNVPCDTNQGAGCMYNDMLCKSSTPETSCGSPMSGLSAFLCAGALPNACAPLYNVFQYMGHNWNGNSSCGAQMGNWCVTGNAAMNGFALCIP